MNNRYHQFFAKTLALLFVLSGLCLVIAGCSNHQDGKTTTPKKPDPGVVSARSLRKSQKPVTKMEVGKTYISPILEYNDNVWDYFKLIDGTHFLYVEDGAHLRQEYYRDAEGDDKIIKITETTYRLYSQNIEGIKNVRQMILSFDYKKVVKPGIRGTYSDGITQGYGVLSFVKIKGSYVRKTTSNKKVSDPVYLAKYQLPNSIEEYMQEYRLTPDPLTSN